MITTSKINATRSVRDSREGGGREREEEAKGVRGREVKQAGTRFKSEFNKCITITITVATVQVTLTWGVIKIWPVWVCILGGRERGGSGSGQPCGGREGRWGQRMRRGWGGPVQEPGGSRPVHCSCGARARFSVLGSTSCIWCCSSAGADAAACYVSTRRQPDLGGVLSDCHLLSCVGFLQGVFSQYLTRDGTLQHVYSGTATLQPVRSCKQNTQVMNKGSRRALVELLLLGIQGKE